MCSLGKGKMLILNDSNTAADTTLNLGGLVAARS